MSLGSDSTILPYLPTERKHLMGVYQMTCIGLWDLFCLLTLLLLL